MRNAETSEVVCDEFAKGAIDAGHAVEKIRIAEKTIGFCRACYACQKTGACVIKDDMTDILQKMVDCDVMVLASPVYFYSIDAQLKTVIDRSFARYSEVKNKELYYIITAAEHQPSCTETSLACLRGYTRFVKGSKEMGIVYGLGALEKGAIKNNSAMVEAYKMGQSI